jgi:hypothetical protein
MPALPAPPVTLKLSRLSLSRCFIVLYKGFRVCLIQAAQTFLSLTSPTTSNWLQLNTSLNPKEKIALGSWCSSSGRMPAQLVQGPPLKTQQNKTKNNKKKF